MSNRLPHSDEVERAFPDVDTEVLFDLRMAGLLEVQDWGNVVITDTNEMFKFLLRRLFPAKED